MKILTFSELEKIISVEQKAQAAKMFLEAYPEGTPETMYTSENPERDYLTFVDLECFS